MFSEWLVHQNRDLKVENVNLCSWQDVLSPLLCIWMGCGYSLGKPGRFAGDNLACTTSHALAIQME